jgi:hypothetical protein
MSDIQLAEQWLYELSGQIRTLCEQLEVENISVSKDATYIHGKDEKGRYVVSRIYTQGYDGVFLDERFYPSEEGEEDGAAD